LCEETTRPPRPTNDNQPHSVREDIPEQPLTTEAAPRHYRQISRLIQATVAVSVAMTILGGSSLLLLDPALAPWFIGASSIMLANAALWNWIIRGAFQVHGASRRLLIRGIIAKVFLIASVVVLVLVLRPDTQPARLATLAGLLTPLIGLLIASVLPRPRD
jgi:hypothetical protein